MKQDWKSKIISKVFSKSLKDIDSVSCLDTSLWEPKPLLVVQIFFPIHLLSFTTPIKRLPGAISAQNPHVCVTPCNPRLKAAHECRSSCLRLFHPIHTECLQKEEVSQAVIFVINSAVNYWQADGVPGRGPSLTPVPSHCLMWHTQTLPNAANCSSHSNIKLICLLKCQRNGE